MTDTEQAAPTQSAPGVERVIKVALVTYTDPSNRSVHATMGDTVRVHPDHVHRFDELNRPPTFRQIVDTEADIVDVRQPTAVEQRIAKGFGNQPMSVEARARILAAEEAAQEAAESAAAPRKSRG